MGSAYRFDLVNRDGSVDTFEMGESADDGAAAIQARSAMLVSLTAVAVELWRDDARLCRIRRDSAPPGGVHSFHGFGVTAFSSVADDGRPPSAKVASA